MEHVASDVIYTEQRIQDDNLERSRGRCREGGRCCRDLQPGKQGTRFRLVILPLFPVYWSCDRFERHASSENCRQSRVGRRWEVVR